ncbi:hypothetical protein N7532_004478 [Penicillium argentinense]|uniref:Uncharacterized protein n=1 Tax=Penicillium argentinense TaxID=1131581 RepID=A0A9W9KEY2_9EURO|nr:uncharacterized protein N7532_004478 [Penicillium argentinense]KAJ5103949.1 hypothetical protein N7532_004478 [Penicillium argentinense]
MKTLLTSLLPVLALLLTVEASPWIGTQYIAVTETVLIEGFTGTYITEDPVVRTQTIQISPTVTAPSVISTLTQIVDYSSQVTAVNLVVAPTAGIEATANHLVDYYVSVTYTAPASCSYTRNQTLTTTIPVNVPYYADGLVEPTWMSTTVEKFSYITGSITEINALLDPTAIPASVFSSASSYYKPAYYTSCYSYYSDSGSTGYRSEGSDYSGCTEFTWYFGASPFSGGYCCSDGCHYTWGITPWGLALAIFFGWFGLFLIIGLVESWFIYRRAMLGQKVRRGLPYAFACLCPILSCLFLLSVKRHPPKTPDQQAFLAARWAEMSSGKKFSSWFKNMFSRKDPTAEALGFTTAMPPQMPYPPQDPNQWYPAPGAPGAPGMPPMATYSPPPQPGHPGHPGPTDAPRGEELDGEPKTIAVSESERNDRA